VRPLRRLRLFVQTMGYLRRDQATSYFFRRIVRRGSKPHRAADVPRVRGPATVAFPRAWETKVLDRLCLAGRDEETATAFARRTTHLWRPLRIQIHYFDYLNDPNRSDPWKRAIVSDWIANNPRALGDGWTAYPVSLRIVNWIKFFVRLAPTTIEERFGASLYEQALWLEKNLELHILANHYLKNAKALLFAGMYFEGVDADRWRDVGLRIFLSELDEQFLADGGHYERSPMYHAISLEDILDVYNYLHTGARPENARVLETLRARAVAGLDFMSAMLLPDGASPLFNDSSNDVGSSPMELFAYARTVLGYERSHVPAGLLVRALASSGYYVIRDGTSALVIDCGPLGPDYQPGHGHCDTLSYELVLNGERVVVDTGAFDYEPNEQRRYARGTAAHNTVQIDGAEQSEIWDVFRVARRAKPLAASLALLGPHEAAFTGAHDGYGRAPTRTIHHRTVRYARGEWYVEDRLEGSGSHLIESRVHLHPLLRAELSEDGVQVSARDGRPIALLRASPDVELRIVNGAYFPRFGMSQQRDVVTLTLETALPATLTYSISPHAS
jgi:uncharacterized heparinase superfamily protein